MAAEKIEQFKRFETEMSAPPTPLRNVCPKQKAALLRNLFNLARLKANFESWKYYETEGVPEARQRRARFESMRSHLSHALEEVQEAKETLGELFDELLSEDFDFEEIVEKIGYGLQTAETFERLSAASIHPALRTPKEAAIALETGEYEGTAAGVYPLRQKYALDYWFIGEAESVLKNFKTAEGKNLRQVDYDRIISRVFSAAFGTTYEESRVKTARLRIHKRPRPHYVRPFSNIPLPD